MVLQQTDTLAHQVRHSLVQRNRGHADPLAVPSERSFRESLRGCVESIRDHQFFYSKRSSQISSAELGCCFRTGK